MAEAAVIQRSVLETIPGLKQLVLLVAIALAVAAGGWLIFWSQGQTYTVLYGNLEGRQAGQVMDQLTAAGIPFKLDEKTGAILVPQEKVASARLQAAQAGGRQDFGMDSLDSASPGTSQFMETARYQRALEIELARTVTQVQGVMSARVHLALPKQSAFIRDRKKATAAVTVQLAAGRHLDQGQVAAIVNMIASSVPELEPDEVTLVDQNGTLYSSPDDGGAFTASAKQLEYQREVERTYAQRVEDMLLPIVGPGRVRAGVTADVDFTQTESTRENYDPKNPQMVRSEQTASEQRLPGDTAQGIPGALSNQPPNTTGAPPAAQQQPAPANAAGAGGTAGATAAAATPVATSQRATRNFEIDKATTYTKAPVGVLRKLSVAVLLDDLQKTDANGTTTTTPLTQADLDRFTGLVKQAIGFDEARGDKVNVMNQSFHVEPASTEEEPSTPFYSQPWFKDVGKQVVGVVLVLLLLFMVVRPVMRSLTTVSVAPPALGGPMGAMGELGSDRVTIGVGGGASIEQQVAAARSLVGQDPKRAAAVVKDWVAADS